MSKMNFILASIGFSIAAFGTVLFYLFPEGFRPFYTYVTLAVTTTAALIFFANRERAAQKNFQSSLHKAVEEVFQTVLVNNTKSQKLLENMEDFDGHFNQIFEAHNELINKAQALSEIVFQTKLLSFNTSAKAARSDGQDAIYVNLAQELCHLATLSGEITQQIEDGLETNQQLTKKTVEALHHFLKGTQETNTLIRLAIKGDKDQSKETDLSEQHGLAQSQKANVA